MSEPVILIHGGAGAGTRDEPAYAGGLGDAANAGYAVLDGGGGAVEAVCAAVRSMEDDPAFNAGYGAVLNARGEVECDAAVGRGTDRKFGAVAAVKGVLNPVMLARLVLDSSQVMFAGEGAVRFGEDRGMSRCDPAQLITQERFVTWAQWVARGSPDVSVEEKLEGCDTVGAVARDAGGEFAVATSTGGVQFKPLGRVGDSPLPGCGFWADTEGAASATGEGEFIARVLLCHRVLELVNDGVEAAAAIREMESLVGGHGGLIALDRDGEVHAARNTPVMGHAWRRAGMTHPVVRGTTPGS